VYEQPHEGGRAPLRINRSTSIIDIQQSSLHTDVIIIIIIISSSSSISSIIYAIAWRISNQSNCGTGYLVCRSVHQSRSQSTWINQSIMFCRYCCHCYRFRIFSSTVSRWSMVKCLIEGVIFRPVSHCQGLACPVCLVAKLACRKSTTIPWISELSWAWIAIEYLLSEYWRVRSRGSLLTYLLTYLLFDSSVT